jgi:[ribosomal protein S5]-alanine N-acetyltransferase
MPPDFATKLGDLRMRTARLDLVATTIEHLRVELEAPEQLTARLEAVVPASWPPGLYDRDAMEFFRARMAELGEAAVGWYGWYAILRAKPPEPAVLVAAGGYFGPPAPDGTVEIGYSVASEHRAKGYATELVGALVARAFGTPGIVRVIAHAAETNIASHTVLERSGFRRVGPGGEPGHLRFERVTP